jgi:phosphate-selective porin OprO/OprP
LSGRPEAHLAPRFVDTGSFDGKTLHMIGTELALVNGPVSLQSEYVRAFVTRPNANRVDFSSLYVLGSYFLTGEHRTYENATGVFGRVSPKHNFEGLGQGWGAWEIAARYSRLNLDDQPIFGGKLQDVTLGLNWYLNPNTRVMWNYVHADRIDTGSANIFQTRFQVDF